MIDSAHCGKCGDKCDIGKICIDGSCIENSTITYCNGVRMDAHIDMFKKFGSRWPLSDVGGLFFDSANCRQCERKCNIGEVCLGDCMTQDQARNITGLLSGMTICDNQIVFNMNQDSTNCGQCGNKCGFGEICKSGKCETGTGGTYCDGKGVDTSKDATNCGQCGFTCPTGVKCISGQCVTTQCGSITTSLMDDSANCAQCGYKCGKREICKNGKCETGIGNTYCDGKGVDISKDTANCGQCGNKCSVDEECISGRCV